MNLFIFRQSPYGTSFAAEGLRVLSSFVAFDMDVAVLFTDDGVFSLKKGQDPHELEMKSIGEGIEMVTGLGIEKILVSRESLAERGLIMEELMDVKMQVLTINEIQDLMDEACIILTF